MWTLFVAPKLLPHALTAYHVHHSMHTFDIVYVTAVLKIFMSAKLWLKKLLITNLKQEEFVQFVTNIEWFNETDNATVEIIAVVRNSVDEKGKVTIIVMTFYAKM